MKIAILGDVHGGIKDMYKDVSNIETAFNTNIGCILQVGDFQAIRNKSDLLHFHAPLKYKKEGDFPLFYERGSMPKSTLFIGGNHENDLWLSKYPDGGELIENLIYLGRAGTLKIDNCIIGWVSGTYSERDYNNPGNEKAKFYHFTPEDVNKLINSNERIDVLVFHDWPSIRSLKQHIDYRKESDKTLDIAIRRGLGNEVFYDIIKQVKPRHVFAGHMHMHLDLEAMIDGSKTRFVALDKIGMENKLYVLDTINLDLEYYNIKRDRTFFDVIPANERAILIEGFSELKKKDLPMALHHFERVLEDEYSQKSKSFANYGLGVAYFRLDHEPKHIDMAIRYLMAAKSKMDFADIHFMLGMAIKEKLTEKGISLDEQSIISIDMAINELKISGELNKGFKSYAEKITKELEDEKDRLLRNCSGYKN